MAADPQRLIASGAALAGVYIVSSWAAESVINQSGIIGKALSGGLTAGAVGLTAAYLVRQGKIMTDDFAPVAVAGTISAVALKQMMPSTRAIAGRPLIGWQPINQQRR